MQRVATIHVYESWGDVVATCKVVDFDEVTGTPGRTSRSYVQVPGKGIGHPTGWMADALDALSKTYPEPDDGE